MHKYLMEAKNEKRNSPTTIDRYRAQGCKSDCGHVCTSLTCKKMLAPYHNFAAANFEALKLTLAQGLHKTIVTCAVTEEFAAHASRRHNQDSHAINFKVKLNKDPRGGVGNDGSGLLTLPTSNLGSRFLEWVKRDPLEIDKKKIKFQRRSPAPKWLTITPQRTQYVDPVDEVRQKKLDDLLLVGAIQFGLFYRPKYPSTPLEPLTSRAFSVEYRNDTKGRLSFEYDHKLIRIQVLLSFTVQCMRTGSDDSPSLKIELESLLHNCLLHAEDVEKLLSRVRGPYFPKGPHIRLRPFAKVLRRTQCLPSTRLA